ncbi:MAG: carboxypeptidase-like regulatory domain-containing protein, partial [Candidatus Cloacimonetes bacterium]|nr:carboxypeptidase-like regulatory domain-containing protein [Candidatus Cloacimonadota bacterium]
VKFNAKWDKRWFKNSYTIMSELASTEISDRQRKIENENRIKSRDIMSAKVQDFTDENFWGGYNIIEPDASIESIISRIIRQLNRRDKENQ